MEGVSSASNFPPQESFHDYMKPDTVFAVLSTVSSYCDVSDNNITYNYRWIKKQESFINQSINHHHPIREFSEHAVAVVDCFPIAAHPTVFYSFLKGIICY